MTKPREYDVTISGRGCQLEKQTNYFSLARRVVDIHPSVLVGPKWMRTGQEWYPHAFREFRDKIRFPFSRNFSFLLFGGGVKLKKLREKRKITTKERKRERKKDNNNEFSLLNI